MENKNGYMKRIPGNPDETVKSSPSNQKKHAWLLGLVIALMVIFSLQTLTTKPRIWADEALSMELAHNFMRFNVLNVQTAPGIFFQLPQLLQSTGYPVLVPGALFFSIVGFDFVQIRLYMLVWMVAVIGIIFVFLRRIFNSRLALSAVLLIVTFASFYGNGRTLVGEIPGLFFLIAGLYVWWIKEKYILAGLLLGLAVMVKPSVYLNILPAIVLIEILYNRKKSVKNLALILVGSIPTAVAWVLLVVPHPFESATWTRIFGFFANPYDSVSVADNMINNFLHIPRQLSLVYFILLLIPIIIAFHKVEDRKIKVLYHFTLLYSAVSFFYYLRSPGWMRYLIVSQILILMLFPYAIERCVLLLRKKMTFLRLFNSVALHRTIIGFFLIIQTLQLFFMSHIYASDAAQRATNFVLSNFENKSIGLINVPEIAAFVDPNHKFQVINHLVGIPQIGDVALWPQVDIIVVNSGDPYMPGVFDPLQTDYTIIESVEGYDMYQRIDN